MDSFVSKMMRLPKEALPKIRSDSGAAVPVTILSLVTLTVICFVAFVIVRDVLRVAVALPF